MAIVKFLHNNAEDQHVATAVKCLKIHGVASQCVKRQEMLETRINQFIAGAKLVNMELAWQGVKQMQGLNRPTTNNFDLMNDHEQTTLANAYST